MSEVLDKPVATAKPREESILVDGRIGLAEHKRQDHVVDAEEGTTVERVMEPAYWSHVAAKLQMHDRIEVRQETGEWILDLIVVGVGRNWARMYLAAKHDLTATAGEAPSTAVKHKVVWKGHHKKHCVVRIADSAMIQDGFESKGLAEEWLLNHERVTL